LACRHMKELYAYVEIVADFCVSHISTGTSKLLQCPDYVQSRTSQGF
jgi:hypothetical protein